MPNVFEENEPEPIPVKDHSGEVVGYGYERDGEFVVEFTDEKTQKKVLDGSIGAFSFTSGFNTKAAIMKNREKK